MNPDKITCPEGKAVVRFLPYRREGTIEVPDADKPESCEAEVVYDSKGDLEPDTKVICSTMDGQYWDAFDKYGLCTIQRRSIYMIFTEKDGKIDTLEPVGKAVITTDEEPIRELGGFALADENAKPVNKGVVMAIGKARMDFAVGATVYFEQHRAAKIKIDGRKAMFVPLDLIHAFEEAA